MKHRLLAISPPTFKRAEAVGVRSFRSDDRGMQGERHPPELARLAKWESDKDVRLDINLAIAQDNFQALSCITNPEVPFEVAAGLGEGPC